MRSSWRKTLFWTGVTVLASLVLTLAIAFTYVGVITHRIDARIDQLRSTQATSFYAFYPAMRRGQEFSAAELKSLLADQGYVERTNGTELSPGEYLFDGASRLTLFRPPFEGAGHPLDSLKAQVVFSPVGDRLAISELVRADDGQPLETLDQLPKKVAAYFAGRLRTQNSVSFSDMPVSVRHAVMAIEDVRFLEHHGVSIRGTLRALWTDLKAGGFVEGGSTITQQLMKNLFFSREKALSRKVKEAVFAMVTEARHPKEAILEAYLNEVYMGQLGTHEIHGVSEGARYYFNRPVSSLSLAQSATLAAIIQAPNAQDPHRFPERTIKRRNLVLKKMRDAEFILPDEYDMAVAEPIGVAAAGRNLADVDYSIDLVLQRLPADIRARLDKEPLTIYISLNPYLQSAASDALVANIARLQKISPEIRKKEEKGKHLQGALIAVDVKNCAILALQGGRSYRQTQFNRVVQGKRQPGSLFKPFVYLAAFADEKEPRTTPLTMLEDAPFEWKYEAGQTWSPRNFDNEFRGPVSARRSLEMSLNVPTARLAEKVGLAPIRDAMVAAGIESPLPLVPSLTLGSAEVTPLELARAFTTVANLGTSCDLRPYYEVFDGNRNALTKNGMETKEVLPKAPTFQTVQLMKGVLTHGSARSAMASGIPVRNFAGKTGTTNDSKDAWFVGFSPDLLVLVWVGYDEEEKVGLGGSAAALPMWVDFIKHARPFVSSADFVAPDGLVKTVIERGAEPPSDGSACQDPLDEYFVPGTEPSSHCPTPSAG